jgi:hypothetical protein
MTSWWLKACQWFHKATSLVGHLLWLDLSWVGLSCGFVLPYWTSEVCFYGICERHSCRLSVKHPMHNCGTRTDRIGCKSIWCHDWILPAAGWRAQPFTPYKENFKISQSFDTFWERSEKPMWKLAPGLETAITLSSPFTNPQWWLLFLI